MERREARDREARSAGETEDELARGVGRGEPEGGAEGPAVGPSRGEGGAPYPETGGVNQGEYVGPTHARGATEDPETEAARESVAEAAEEATTARSGRRNRPAATRSGALPPPGYERPDARREPRSTDEARRDLEETRSRISHTLDEIEDRVDEKKRTLQENTIGMVHRAKDQIVRRPLFTMGVAFGAGLAFGLMTGGGDDEEESAGGGRSFVGRTTRHLAMMAASRYAARWLRSRIG